MKKCLIFSGLIVLGMLAACATLPQPAPNYRAIQQHSQDAQMELHQESSQPQK